MVSLAPCCTPLAVITLFVLVVCYVCVLDVCYVCVLVVCYVCVLVSCVLIGRKWILPVQKYELNNLNIT